MPTVLPNFWIKGTVCPEGVVMVLSCSSSVDWDSVSSPSSVDSPLFFPFRCLFPAVLSWLSNWEIFSNNPSSLGSLTGSAGLAKASNCASLANKAWFSCSLAFNFSTKGWGASLEWKPVDLDFPSKKQHKQRWWIHFFFDISTMMEARCDDKLPGLWIGLAINHCWRTQWIAIRKSHLR